MIKVDFKLKRLDNIINELTEQIKYFQEQRDNISNKREELARCENMINN